MVFKNNIIKIIILCSVFINCTYNKLELNSKDVSEINLIWYRSYEGDSVERSLLGLRWILSYIGSKTPNHPEGLKIIDSNIISLNLNYLGFQDFTLEKLKQLNEQIILSEGYRLKNGFDMGQYACLVFGSSENYYNIVGIPNKFESILVKYNMLNLEYYINNSAISKQHRKIKFSKLEDLKQMSFSIELDAITNEILEYETIEIMPNGNLKFGIFDKNGNRIPVADNNITNAGKPGKCMWCHESHYNPLFSKQNQYQGYSNWQDFNKIVDSFFLMIRAESSQIPFNIDYMDVKAHTNAELLYIGFMEPNLNRIAAEWGKSMAETQYILQNLPMHDYPEFSFMKNLYNRLDIESLAPYKSLPVSGSVREMNLIEVNNFK